MFFKKRKKPTDFAPLGPADEAKPLADDVPRPLTFKGESYTVLDSVIYRERMFLICVGGKSGGKVTMLETDGNDANCRAVEESTASAAYRHYILQPK